MEKYSARKLTLFIKSLVFIFLASTSLSVSAGYVYLTSGSGAYMGKHHAWKHARKCGCGYHMTRYVPTYYGPDCCCTYWGKGCYCGCGVVWVPCHWDVYGNYVPGYWMSFRR